MKKPKKCKNCSATAADGATFAHFARTGQPDPLCVRCRFNHIDGKYSNVKGIRDDMEAAGIPVSRGSTARRLRFRQLEPASPSPDEGPEASKPIHGPKPIEE